jgi:predicted nucleotidyltransferase
VKAIVFGSFADGLETEDSDLDVLVICTSEADIKRCRDAIYAGLRGPVTVVPVDFIFVSSERYHEMSVRGGVCMAAKESGFTLWESGCD